MARASKLACVGMAVGMALAPAEAQAQAPAAADASAQAGQSQARPSRVHVALNTAIDSYRRGEYDVAAGFFKQAQAGQAGLSESERQDLKTWIDLNNAAVGAQADGVKKLNDAEAAAKAGRTQDALALVKAVTATQQFLAPADKLRLQKLGEQLRPADGKTTPAAGSPALAQARAKVQQARGLMAKGNHDAAQALATEADRLGAPFTATEDTPKKVLEDIAKSRAVVVEQADAKGYLKAARQAYDKGDLDMAEHLARESEKAGSWSGFRMWGDTPAKVLKDVQAARAKKLSTQQITQSGGKDSSRFSPFKPMFSRGGAAPAVEDKGKPAVETTPAAGTPVSVHNHPQELLVEARKAHKDGDYAKARQLAAKAKALKSDGNWWDDSPDKVLADVQRAEAEKTVVNLPADPKAQLKMGRDLLAAGKLEEAEQVALKATGAKSSLWSLFDDSPDKLLEDVRTAKAKRDSEESVKVLAEARKLFETANGDVKKLEEAVNQTYRAERLHGPYSAFDLSERPHKLRAEVESVLTAARRSPAPVVAKVDSVPAPVPPAVTTQAADVRQVDNRIAAKPAVAPAPVVNESKPTAVKLVAEARQLQQEGRLLEAREKAVSAQKLKAAFTPEEDRPEMVLLALSALCEKRIEVLLHQAGDHATAATTDPARALKAEADLAQAKQLAVSFGIDAQRIDAKMAQLRPAAAQAPGSPVVPQLTLNDKPPAAPAGRGEALLNQARLELRKGETRMARQLAEEAHTGSYGVQAEAEKVLRSIDAEEANQRILAAGRSFDAGLQAHQRKDYSQAASILRGIDKQLLPPEKQQRLGEMMLLPELQPAAVAQAALKPAPAVDTGVARATDDPAGKATAQDAGYAQQFRAMQDVKFQALQQDGTKVMRDANDLFRAGETDRALEVLQDHVVAIRDAQLDPDRVAKLQRPMDTMLSQFRTLKSRRDFEKLQATQAETFQQAKQREFRVEEAKKKQVADLMKQYHTFFKEGKYKDAEMLAMRAKELDPDNPIVPAAIYTARIQANQAAASGVNAADG